MRSVSPIFAPSTANRESYCVSMFWMNRLEFLNSLTALRVITLSVRSELAIARLSFGQANGLRPLGRGSSGCSKAGVDELGTRLYPAETEVCPMDELGRLFIRSLS